MNAQLSVDAIRELLKLAHKLPSPRSATDIARIEQTDATNVNNLAVSFTERILDLAITFMQFFYGMTRIKKEYIVHALEAYVRLDIMKSEEIYAFVNSNEVDYNESDDSDYSNYEDENNLNEDENSDEEADHLMSDHEEENSDGEGHDVSVPNTFPRNIRAMTFDAYFDPLENEVRLSNSSFTTDVVEKIFEGKSIFGVTLDDEATTILKDACYAYTVHKLR